MNSPCVQVFLIWLQKKWLSLRSWTSHLFLGLLLFCTCEYFACTLCMCALRGQRGCWIFCNWSWHGWLRATTWLLGVELSSARAASAFNSWLISPVPWTAHLCMSCLKVCALRAQCPWLPEDGVGFPWTGVRLSCENAGNRTLVLWEGSQSSQLLTLLKTTNLLVVLGARNNSINGWL